MIRQRLACIAVFLPAFLPFMTGDAPGAELVVRDAQIAVLGEPAGYQYSLSSPSYSADGRDGFSTSGAVEIGGRYSLARPGDAIGLVLGLDLGLRDATGSSTRLRTLLGHGSVGIGWAVTDRWLITLEGGAGVGSSSLTLDGTAYYPSFSGDGTAIIVDGRLTAGFLVTDSWRVLGMLGYGRSTGRYEQDRTELTITQSGLSAGLGVAYVFSRAPVLVK